MLAPAWETAAMTSDIMGLLLFLVFVASIFAVFARTARSTYDPAQFAQDRVRRRRGSGDGWILAGAAVAGDGGGCVDGGGGCGWASMQAIG